LAIFTGCLIVVGILQKYTLDKTDETLKIAQRATAHHSGFLTHQIREDDNVGWIIAARFDNAGGSPTSGLTMHLRYLISENALPRDFDIDIELKPPLVDSAIAGIIGPKQTITGLELCLRDSVIRNIRDEKLHGYIAGWTTYLDTFDETNVHIAMFCSEVIREVGTPTPIYSRIKDARIAYRFCPTHNCADKQCDKYPESNRLRDGAAPTPNQAHTFDNFCVGLPQ
jgi:hypothetical protein